MSNFYPGRVVSTFTSRSGHEVTIRYPRWDDLEQLTAYINKLSQEHTFIRFSGEVISLEEERRYLSTVFEKNEVGDGVTLYAEVNGQIMGSVDVNRNKNNYRRSMHAGIFGISLAADYRGQGIGQHLAETVIAEAQREISGLTMLWLTVYSPNEVGMKLYTKLGFTECGRIPKHVLHRGEYVDEVIMSRAL